MVTISFLTDIFLGGASDAEHYKKFIYVGHLYGVRDHYGNGTPSTDSIIEETGNMGYNEECIYGEDTYDLSVINNLTICDGCKSIIEANKARYNHN